MEDATQAEQIAEMYNNQVGCIYIFAFVFVVLIILFRMILFSLTLNPQDIIKNQNKDKKTSPEDDFDF